MLNINKNNIYTKFERKVEHVGSRNIKGAESRHKLKVIQQFLTSFHNF
jgi:hypothetical protein